ncbi:MAG: HEAT repeat domain-containing protein [Treponema sp.]|jgi:HEAT repeat protein|nr:HEAT repeat domain-containing protein [Treponema sp.]
MEDLSAFLTGINIPAWTLPASFAALFLLILFIVWFVQTRIFKYRLRKIVNAKGARQRKEAVDFFAKHYPPEKLTRYSRRMERYSRQMGPEVVRKTGLADKWIQKVARSVLPTAVDLRRVLLYCPESSAFKVYLAAEKHPRLRRVITAWMRNVGEEKAIRLLSESCRGEDFEPGFGKNFLENNSALIRELTGEPEWHARYFAYKILINDKDALAQRSLEAGLLDPHPLVRKILTGSFSGDRKKVWSVLWDRLIHDPVYEVRETAKKRIVKEFMDMYSLKDKVLSAEENFRILELLDPNSQEDKSFAMAMLQSDSKELQYPAAVFLEKCGILALYLSRNKIDDYVTIRNSVRLLKNAMDVKVSGFLTEYSSGDGAPLLVAANLLAGTKGLHENVYYLAKKVFAFFANKKAEPSYKEIYTRTLEAIAVGGSVKSFELLAEELARRENDPVFLEMLLPRLTAKADLILSPLLFRFLENVNFRERDTLIKVLGNFSPEIVLPEVFHILNNGRTKFHHVIRISALKILGQLRLPFCFQRALESLPTLTAEETEEFAQLITHYPKEVFEDKAKTLLASPDAQVRASIISILPIVKNDSFMKEIRASLRDVDPDVRVAAIKSLLGFGEIKLLNQETSMLHDPVERVRLATAEVIARHGNQAAIEILKNVTVDPNETEVVKTGVIAGLGQAVNAEGIPLLVSVLDSQEEFQEQAVNALAMRTSKRDITQLIEIFKNAEPQLREKLIPVFKKQGNETEPIILEILKEEVRSLKPYLVKILEETGYVEEAKRRLSNRDVEVRREAATMLSLLDTLPAFRGLVMAAKDPDKDVRICVVKALEKLKGSQSYDFLEKLKQDPDSRVRRYTNWALERLDSLAMD